MRLAPPRLEDAEALTDLHLGVWEEAYAGLMAWSTEGRLLGFSSTGPGRDSGAGR
ncbi:hypothetical protein [Nocardioides sp. S5]|uniref:hypothetical protein n=1 Tax=Nocardioides sp. S5 TaxID=2017486 RepID=UPI001A8C4D0C|nr:hypothetical protein [Nocardioides sp. S5]